MHIYVHICIHTKVYIYTLLTVLLRCKKNDFLFSNLGDCMFILFSQLLLSLLGFSLAVTKHPNHRGKGLFHLTTLTPWSQSIVREVGSGTQGKRSETGTGVEATEECCSLACSPLFPQLAFFIQPRFTCPRVVLSTVDWDSHINH